jgi:inner membrane protein
MMGVTHALAGALVGLAAGGWAGAAAGALGALLPDIDHPHSIAGRRSGVLGGAVRLVVGHRGALHSGLAVAVVLALGWSLGGLWWAGALGYASHVGLDMLTASGVPLAWPWRQRVRLIGLRTGGIIERLLMLSLLVVLVWRAYEAL